MAHRDLKPQNVFLDEFMTVKIADFGLQKLFEDPDDLSMKKLTTHWGTPAYKAPELCKEFNPNCKEYLGPPVDIFAMGVMFYMTVTSKYPWPRATDNTY